MQSDEQWLESISLQVNVGVPHRHPYVALAATFDPAQALRALKHNLESFPTFPKSYWPLFVFSIMHLCR